MWEGHRSVIGEVKVKKYEEEISGGSLSKDSRKNVLQIMFNFGIISEIILMNIDREEYYRIQFKERKCQRLKALLNMSIRKLPWSYGLVSIKCEMPSVKTDNTFRDELSFIIQFGWNHVYNIRPNTREGCFFIFKFKIKKGGRMK